jgi:hypothetical protein
VSSYYLSAFVDIRSSRNLQNNKRLVKGAERAPTPMPKTVTNLLTFQEYLKNQNLENIHVSNT